MVLVVDRVRLCFMLLLAISIMPAFADDTSMGNKISSGPGYGVGYSVQQTSDGGYIIVGSMYTNKIGLQSQMVWLIKTDGDGNKVWDRMFSGPRNDVGYSVQQIRDGGYIIAGVSESFGAGSQNAWLIKTDANGNEIWNRTFG